MSAVVHDADCVSFNSASPGPCDCSASQSTVGISMILEGWKPLNHMPIGDHRFIVVEYLGSEGQTGFGYWSGEIYAKAPVNHGEHEPLGFKPVALRHVDQEEPAPPAPIAWLLRETKLGRSLIMPGHCFKSAERAASAAVRMTGKWRTVTVVPVREIR
ncbi:hypothetical protein NUH86_01580 [Sphingobium sp. JS3065]|uniref:hypothetical protein n=1 Tax=Sphingobium sp. JS3065 TaxID=2970925 RepID=UPI002263C1EE|nr:hypothetical protein [Sphingobium sp. JS3065]UZW55521.1 hypothetical protein NUH86_01580 [Sphingobium sp. JS3065]